LNPTIRNIIFDIGNVLVEVNYQKFLDGLVSEGVPRELLDEEFLNTTFKNGFESGEISADDFVSQSVSRLNNRIPREKFVRHFNSMFSEIPGMRDFVSELRTSGRYKLLVLSNTNPLHMQKFDFLNLFDCIALSYELKLLKPDIRIYKKVLELYNLNPAETLYIDDNDENCASAGKAGLITVVFHNPENLIAEFRRFGIAINS
jgi:HAD superfamily hydrolase (TIGR01509 family)